MCGVMSSTFGELLVIGTDWKQGVSKLSYFGDVTFT